MIKGNTDMSKRIISMALALLPMAGIAMAQEASDATLEAGRTEFLSACAGCHGQDAHGDGPMADLMKISTPDLTGLTERAGGTFPFRNTLLLIDGRNEVRAHGGDMPIWGDRYMVQARISEAQSELPEVPDMVTKGRLLSLVYYLESIQE